MVLKFVEISHLDTIRSKSMKKKAWGDMHEMVYDAIYVL